jgi:hypothetical protein
MTLLSRRKAGARRYRPEFSPATQACKHGYLAEEKGVQARPARSRLPLPAEEYDANSWYVVSLELTHSQSVV